MTEEMIVELEAMSALLKSRQDFDREAMILRLTQMRDQLRAEAEAEKPDSTLLPPRLVRGFLLQAVDGSIWWGYSGGKKPLTRITLCLRLLCVSLSRLRSTRRYSCLRLSTWAAQSSKFRMEIVMVAAIRRMT